MARRFLILIVLLCALSANAAAQQEKQHGLGVAATSALLFAGVIGLMPFDARISESFDNPWPQQNQAMHNSAVVFNHLGDPGAALIAMGVWGAGLVSGSDEIEDAGFHATSAIVVSGAVTGLLKGIAGRARPKDSPGDADNFKFAGGFNGQGGVSFPSGHTTAAFALAATLSAETRRHNPDAARYVSPIAYGAASLVGLSRIYSQKHWASDVVLGAAIGTFTARKLYSLHHRKKR